MQNRTQGNHRLPDLNTIMHANHGHQNIPANQNNQTNKNIETALLKILKNQDYIINAIHDIQDRI